jgi:polyphosphate glucokinase
MADPRTLAVDIGGTGIKLAVLDAAGKMIGEPVRVPTPSAPVAPQKLIAAIDSAAARLGGFDRVSVGFPGAVRRGRVLTAPHLGTEAWAGFDLQAALAKHWKKPVRVMNDADVQGFGAIRGKGVEMVVTLGTGFGTAIFDDGRIMPHLELAHHPMRGKKTYDDYIGNAALHGKGRSKWNKRVARVIDILRRVVNFDHLYIGGGNAKQIAFPLPPDVTTVPNSDGLTGGIALWQTAAPAVAKPVHVSPKKPRPAKPSAQRPGGRAVRSREAAAVASHPRTMTASQPKTAIAFAVPSGACDCHVHVFGTAATFPFAPSRGYTPPAAEAEELLALQQALRLSRVVIVQPSVYAATIPARSTACAGSATAPAASR